MQYEYLISLSLADKRAVLIDYPTSSDLAARKDAVTLRTNYGAVERVIGSCRHSV